MLTHTKTLMTLSNQPDLGIPSEKNPKRFKDEEIEWNRRLSS